VSARRDIARTVASSSSTAQMILHARSSFAGSLVADLSGDSQHLRAAQGSRLTG